MVVVADTSPINYLVLIGQIEILPRLYTEILIPHAVLEELKHPVAPEPVRDWAAYPPNWLQVLTPKRSLTLEQLDLGETEAIALAIEMHAEVLLIDDQAGRQEAARRGLKVAGTLSILDEADQPVSSISMQLLLSCARLASGFRKRSWPRSKKGDLADSGARSKLSPAPQTAHDTFS